MTLHEYLEARNGHRLAKGGVRVVNKNSLTVREKAIFGIQGCKKNIEISPEQLKEAITYVLKSDWVKEGVKTRLMKLVSPHISKDTQFLYLFRNADYQFKIGVSIHPARRARNLATAGGRAVYIVGVWEVTDAKYEEKHLHHVFKKDRGIGEWFEKLLTVEDIESNIVGEFKRMEVMQIDAPPPVNSVFLP